MTLNEYDAKRVRIIDRDGTVFEGICEHNSRDYNWHEFGRYEDSLQIECFMFYKDDIKAIEVIDEYSAPYGSLEELTVRDGIDLIEQGLESEEDEHVLRLLACLKDYAAADKLRSVQGFEKIVKALESVIKYSENEEIRERAKELKEIIGR